MFNPQNSTHYETFRKTDDALLDCQRDTVQNYDFTQEFYSMDMSKILRLGDYAEIFGIKGTASGKSPARHLWEQLQIAHEKLTEG